VAPTDDPPPEPQVEQLRAIVAAQATEIGALSERLDAPESSKFTWAGRSPRARHEAQNPIPVRKRLRSRPPAVAPMAQPDPPLATGLEPVRRPQRVFHAGRAPLPVRRKALFKPIDGVEGISIESGSRRRVQREAAKRPKKVMPASVMLRKARQGAMRE